MAMFDAADLPDDICKFKKNETKKYRDAVCEFFSLQLIKIDGDGNCFFGAISTAMAHFPVPLDLSVKELRSRIVEWLEDCKVRMLPPYTAMFCQQVKPVHHFTPPCYRTESVEMLVWNATDPWLTCCLPLCISLMEPRVRRDL
jgi:hypothetical protein